MRSAASIARSARDSPSCPRRADVFSVHDIIVRSRGAGRNCAQRALDEERELFLGAAQPA